MCVIRRILLMWNIYQSLSIPTARHVQTEWVQYFDQGLEGPGSYVYGYDIEDSDSDNIQFRHERRALNGTIVGSYGLLEPDGNVKIVNYVADELGYRANIENTKPKDDTNHKTYPGTIETDTRINDVRRLETTKSPFLQSAEKHLPFLGQNNLNEKHIPPSLYTNIPSGSRLRLILDRLYS